MTTIDFHDSYVETTSRAARPGILSRWFSSWRRRRTQRITLGELNRMSAYHLRDMGIEPQDIIDALEGRDRSLLFNPMRRHEE